MKFISVLVCMFVISVSAGIASAGASSAGSNLMPNPSFERGDGEDVSRWIKRAWAGEKAARWSVVSPGRTGGRCVSIASDTGADAAWTATVAIQPKTFYRLSGWIRTSKISGAVGALLNIQNMQHVRTEAVTGTRDWTEVSALFFSGKVTSVEINCLFGGWGSSTGRAWYDDIALEKIAGPETKCEAVVTVPGDAKLVAYSPFIFGGFIEHFGRQIYGGIFDPGSPLSDGEGFRTDVIAALKELNISIVRWPGGCFASGYHWQHGVGKKRRPVFDVVWGVEDPNTFGTDEFAAWCRRVGCEPYICTNAGNGTPEAMRDWVAYCNGASGNVPGTDKIKRDGKPLGVKYWSIGNENWGGHEIGARTPAQWGPLVRTSAKIMLAADPDLVLLAAATPNRNWTLPLLKTAGDLLDYVAIHNYWLPNWGQNHTPDYTTCIMHSEGPENTIKAVVRVLEEAGCRGRIKIAFDEWNLRGWHHPGFPRKAESDPNDTGVKALIKARRKNDIPSQYTMADALFSASFLNACLRHADDVCMANIAPIVNTRGPLYVHDTGLVKRTTFHTLKLYANELAPLVCPLEIASGMLVHGERFIPLVDGIATTDKKRTKWVLALINRHPENQVSCSIALHGEKPDGIFDAKVLKGDSPDAYNDKDHPNRVVPEKISLRIKDGGITLAPHSLTIVAVPRGDHEN